MADDSRVVTITIKSNSDAVNFDAAKQALKDLRTGADDAGAGSRGLMEDWARLTSAFASGELISEAIDKIGSGIKDLSLELGDMVERGSKIADVRDAFARFTSAAGIDAPAALDALRAGSKGLVDDYTLMIQSNKLLSSGMHLTTDDMQTVAAASRDVAKATGKDTAEAFDVLSQALVTGRAKALQAAGVMVDLKGASAELKAQLSAEGEQMSTSADMATKRAAVLEAMRAVVKGAGDQELSFAEQVQQGRVSLANFKDNIGEAIATSPVFIAGLTGISDGFKKAFGSDQQDSVLAIRHLVEDLAINIVSGAAKGIDGLKRMGDAVYDLIPKFEDMGTVQRGELHLLSLLAPAVGDLMTMVDAEYAKYKKQLDDVKAGQEGFDRTLDTLSSSLRNSAKAMQDAQDVEQTTVTVIGHIGTAATQTAAGVEKADAALKSFTTQAEDLSKLAAEAFLHGAMDEFVKQYGTQLEELDRKSHIIGVALPGNLIGPLEQLGSDRIEKAIKPFTEGILNGIQKLDLPKLWQSELNEVEQLNRDAAAQDEQTATAEADYKIAEMKRAGASQRDILLAQLSQEDDFYAAERTRIQQAATDKIAKNHAAGTDSHEVLVAIADDTAAQMDRAAAAHNLRVQQMVGQVQTLRTAWDEFLNQIPAAIDTAMTAGLSGTTTAADVGKQLGDSLGTAAGKFAAKGLATEFGKDASGLLGSTIGSVLGPIGGALGGMIGSLFGGLFGQAGRDAVVKFGDTFTGGLNGLHDKMMAELDPAQADRLWNALAGVGHTDTDAAKRVTDEISAALQKAEADSAAAAKAAQDELNALNSAISKYSLSWKDMTGTKGLEAQGKAAQDLIDDYNRLTKAGYDANTVVNGNAATGAKGMVSDLNDQLRAALNNETKLAPGLTPLVLQLMKSGNLADDVARKMLGLSPAPALPDWQAMETAANKYGIALDSLGPKFEASKLVDDAKTLSDDWQTLAGNGADIGAVMDGMKDKANAYLHDALQWGVQIPLSMKPMLQSMADAGDLTDQNGNKLTDLSKLNWAPDLNQSIQDLVTALQTLFTDPQTGIGAQANQAGKDMTDAFKNATIAPVHVPIVLDWPPGVTPPGGDGSSTPLPGSDAPPGGAGSLSQTFSMAQRLQQAAAAAASGSPRVIAFPAPAPAPGASSSSQAPASAPPVVHNVIYIGTKQVHDSLMTLYKADGAARGDLRAVVNRR